MQLKVIILAAGQGTRMRSNIPKVLHLLAGKPILQHVITTAETLNSAGVYIVYGHEGERVRKELANEAVHWVEQAQQFGTGHAVQQALSHIHGNTRVLILLGDVPLISHETLNDFINQVPVDAVGVLTARIPEPMGLGRIIRDENNCLVKIVEEKDASSEQKCLNEINTGIIIAPLAYLKLWLPLLSNHNAQNEYYLPDIFPLALKENIQVVTVLAKHWEEVQGINDRKQLAFLERYYQQKQAKQLMLSGVTLFDPARFDLRGQLIAAQDVTIDVNVIIEGQVSIGSGTYIGPNSCLRNVEIGENVTIKANSIIEDAKIASHCVIGPFARIRPGTELASEVHIGNFVEVKKSQIGEKTKINHLSYIGDTIIGQKVNVGAGTITCNYDGVNKYQTVIEDNVFIGSDTQLIAPVTIGKGAIIGAGSTVTQDVEANSGVTLTHRLDQRTIAATGKSKHK